MPVTIIATEIFEGADLSIYDNSGNKDHYSAMSPNVNARQLPYTEQRA
jgi:hypothetical protein